MLKLYTHPLSSNARRAHMTALTLGLPVEVIVVDLMKGDQRKPEFLALNPAGKVPVLVDGGTALSESLAIMKYLCTKAPGQTLYPAEPSAQAHVDQWLFWCAQHWNPAASTLSFENMLKQMFGMGDANPYAVERASLAMRDCLALLDATLARHAFIAGESMTLADLAVAASWMAAVPAKFPVEGFAHVARWLESMRALPAWKATEPSRG